MSKRLLLLSNSTMPGEEYFTWPKPHVRAFLGNDVKEILFIPFAGVTISFDDYTKSLQLALEEFGYRIKGIHTETDMLKAIENAECIAVGGGNTFQLIKMIHENGLTEAIGRKVKLGTPYMGWSAGSNVACPSIKTTNDMPIVYPPSFDGLNLIPFQINPHFTDKTIPNHGGETRTQRLTEFLQVNQNMEVMGVPEGAFIQVEGETATYFGTQPLVKLCFNKPHQLISSGSIL